MLFSVTGDNDFSLPHDAYNAKHASRLIESEHMVLLDDRQVHLGDYLNGQDGEIFLFRNDVERISYYAKYMASRFEGIGICATDVEFWRHVDPGMENLARKIIDEYLLSKFGAVISQNVQTVSGYRFWVGRLGENNRQGRSVAFVVDGKWHRYDGSEPLEDWIERLDYWVDDRGPSERRFVIFAPVTSEKNELLQPHFDRYLRHSSAS